MKKILIIILLLMSVMKSSAIASVNMTGNSTVKCGRISDYVFEDGQSNIICANRNAGKRVALTFDDGPGSKYTEEILQILSLYNIKATFFVVGNNVEKNPDILKMIYDNGHEIGNHTYSHPDMRKISAEQIDDEIIKTQKIIKEITGEAPALFRPPGGYLNNIIVDRITANNCKAVLWSWRQDTMDWKCPEAETIVSTVISNIHDGDIILFHDLISGNSPTPCALKEIIPKLMDMGYEFVTVSMLVS